MRAKKRACMTCLYRMDDGKCHRYPPSKCYASALLDFPNVDHLMVCGEWQDRHSDEPLHVMRYDELADELLRERNE